MAASAQKQVIEHDIQINWLKVWSILYSLSYSGKFDARQDEQEILKNWICRHRYPGEIGRPNVIYSNIRVIFIWNRASSSKRDLALRKRDLALGGQIILCTHISPMTRANLPKWAGCF